MRKFARDETGFSLLELMAAIAVLCVLLGVAVPSFVDTINSNRTTSQANELVSALNYARSEAVKRSDLVSVCASANGTSCSGSNDWSTGWIVFTDSTGGAGTYDPPNDVLLQVWPATGGLTLATNGSSIRYQGSGMVVTTRNFLLQKPSCSGTRARQVSIFATGRVSTTKVTCT
jgi:type IV fimbrial biogenesis protein FimT